jgi:hypothetical protein
MKNKQKGTNHAVFHFAGKRLFLYVFMKSLNGINVNNGPLFTSDKLCIWIPMSIETRTDTHAAYIHTASPPPMAPYTLPPSLPHSQKRREPVKDARRKHADRVVGQVEFPGHETRRQSALTHSTSTCPLCPSACTCTCPMNMRHANARVCTVALSLSLDMRAPCMLVRMCMCRLLWIQKANVMHVYRA